MVVKAIYGRRIVWGESVTEDEHRVGLAAYEAALEDGLRGLYPDAWISVQGEGHDSAARVTVDGEDVSETPRVVRVLEEAFSTGCDAIDALNDRLYLLRDEALAAGNTAQVALCDAALGGDSVAYARCIAALEDADGEWRDLSISVDVEGCTVATYWEGDPACVTRVSVDDSDPESPNASARAERVVRRVLDAYGATGYALVWEAGEQGESIARVTEVSQ